MKMLEIVEEYSELSIKRDRLREKISGSNKAIKTAVTDARISYTNEDINMKNLYQGIIREHENMKCDATRALNDVESIIRSLFRQFMRQVDNTNAQTLSVVSDKIFEKKEKVSNNIKELNIQREHAVLKAKDLLIAKEISGDEITHELTDTYIEQIKTLEAKLRYYQFFIDNIQFNLKKKTDYTEETRSGLVH